MIKEYEIMSRGFECLARELGDVETETFIAFLKAAINTSASGYQSHFTSEGVHYQVDIE